MRKVILLSVTILLVISLALIVLADFCTECGTELPKDAKFCPKCGKKAIITEKEHVPLIRGKIIKEAEKKASPKPLIMLRTLQINSAFIQKIGMRIKE